MITTELVNAVDLADSAEDQSEENLNFVFNIIKSVADNCSNDNVSAHKLSSHCFSTFTYIVLFSVLLVKVN